MIKLFNGEKDFSANLDQRWVPIALKPVWHYTHRPDIVGDIVTYSTIASRGSRYEPTSFIAQVDRESINLQFS